MSALRNFNMVRVPEIIRSDVQVRADTIDEQARTVQIVWAAGAPVRRYDWWEREDYLEELSMTLEAIRMDRFASGMSLLDSHNPYSMDDRLGVVIPGSVRIQGGLGLATVQFSRKQRAEELFQDVKDGMPFPVSVGYRVHAYERTEASDTSIARLTATDWEPMELSAVPIPADPAAHSRSEAPGSSQNLTDVPVADGRRERETMPQPNRTGRRDAHDSNPDRMIDERPNGDAPARATREAEMARTYPKPDAVRAFVTRSGGEDFDVEGFVAETRGRNELEIRSAFLDRVVTRQEQAPTFPHAPRNRTASQDDIQARAEALYARVNPAHELSERGRQFAHLTFVEHARDCLRAAGQDVMGASPSQLVTRALNSTSDYPLLLGIPGQRRFRDGYAIQDSEIRKTVRTTSFSDFRVHHSVDLSNAPRLLKVNEHGEYKRGTFKENAQGYALSTYGRIIGMTRQMLINDDLNAFSRVAPRMGQQAADIELAILVNQIEANPELSDGYGVFSEYHQNLGTAAALSIQSLSDARLMMRKQTGIEGDRIGVRPRFLIVPSELETVAETVLTTIAATKTSDVNPFGGRLELIVEHRLKDPAGWYLAADPNQNEGLECAYLEGQEGPQMETKAGWDVDGMEVKVRIDFGAGWIDHRGWFKNPGA